MFAGAGAAAAADAGAAPDAYVVSGAGSAQFNGVYRRDESFNGAPRYKHETADIYLRQGGSANSGFGISAGREGFPGAWPYFCEESRDRKGLQVVPDGGWTCTGGQDAQKPPPSVTPAPKAEEAGPLIYKAAEAGSVGSKVVEAAPPAKLAGQNPLSSSATSEGNAPSAGAELS